MVVLFTELQYRVTIYQMGIYKRKNTLLSCMLKEQLFLSCKKEVQILKYYPLHTGDAASILNIPLSKLQEI